MHPLTPTGGDRPIAAPPSRVLGPDRCGYAWGLTALLGLALVVPPEVVAWCCVGTAVVLAVAGRPPVATSDAVRVTAAAFGALLVGAVVSLLAAGAPADGVEQLGRFAVPLLALGAASSIAPSVSPLAVLRTGATVGALVAGAVAVAQARFAHLPRAVGLTDNAITFGNLALLLGLVAAVSIFSSPMTSRWRWLAVAALTAGIAASVLSETRSGWMALPVLVLLVVVTGGAMRWTTRAALAGAVTAASTLAVVAGGGILAGRLGVVVDEIRAYREAVPGDAGASSSIGGRFEMWRVAVAASRHDPVLGIGWGNLDDRFDFEASAGLRSPRIAEFDHAHNQYLDSLAGGGLVGLVTLLAAFAVPAVVFVRAVRSGDTGSRRHGTIGLTVVAAYALFSLTEAVFHSVVFVAVYGAVVGLAIVGVARQDTGCSPTRRPESASSLS